MAFITLGVLALATLIAALVTGSRILLIANLVVDVSVGGYIAVLLQIKQQQGTSRWWETADDEDMRVLPR